MVNFFSLFSDPLITIAAIITAVSSILVVILGIYYKRLKEQQIISEVTSESDSAIEEKRSKESCEEVSSKLTKHTISPQDYEIILAQLSEISSQLNNLAGYVKEMSSVISTFKVTEFSDNKDFLISSDVISNLISVLERLQIEMSNLKGKVENFFSSLGEINTKLDNLLKLLSTILQQ